MTAATGAVTLGAPADPQDTPPVPPTVAAPAGDLVALTRAELSAMLTQAVQAGVAQATAGFAASNVPTPAEVPANWSHNELLRNLVHKTRWHTEREQRAAQHAVDKYYPIPDEELVV